MFDRNDLEEGEIDGVIKRGDIYRSKIFEKEIWGEIGKGKWREWF